MNKTRTTLTAYAMLLPALVLLGVFTLYPVLYNVVLSFSKYTALELGAGKGPSWVGLENYQKVFSDPLYQTGIVNSLKYLVVVPILQIFSLLVAVLVNRSLPAIAFFRAGYYIPVITSISLAAVMWEWVYAKDGMINAALQGLGVLSKTSAFGWLINENTALWAIMFVTFWQGFGYYMVLYLAGLQSIPTELDEAARLDGATKTQVFWKITVPLMKPTLMICSLLSTLAALRVLQEIMVFTGGGPVNSTYTALFYVYSKAFKEFDYGQGAAAGMGVALIGFLLSYVNYRLTRDQQVTG
ncbi:carbohydrate ABC transporter permease [Deinococcus yavapaiensis]|uniref:Carbohydrate ABC transporter membrane protein 1 (CUT1 family) n=1 Tax=Deinococcus yavapaiensis KR-236 TaxID=694435 RepID=A0A318S9J2_9DEIO|nr:sugar ABC transporter permease [Deinococcus yavapaiensis]PYE55395.1 carbohydrate ABC transporter membrane protein 1 (CUT1 family) [Deinococcus yavapaiensis KR-236]